MKRSRNKNVADDSLGSNDLKDNGDAIKVDSINVNMSSEINAEEFNRRQDSEDEKILRQPFDYISKLPGKQIRSHLSEAFNHWLRIPKDKLDIIMEITRMLHNASLLIDDIEDNSILRRGIPVAHNIYGTPMTINTATYVYFLGLEKTLSLDHPEVTKVFTEQMLELHKGQGMDIHWRDSFTCPTEEQYRRMVIRKTGGLFGLAVRLMQLFSEDDRQLKPLLDNLGLFFQIRDDYANLCSEDYAHNKSFAEDLTEGKFSFPTVYAIQSKGESSSEISNILRQHSKDINVKKYCIEKLKQCGAFDYTIETLKDLEERLRVQIEELGGNEFLWKIILRLSELYSNKNS